MTAQVLLGGAIAFAPISHTYIAPGAAVETVPAGATTVVIEVNHPGGGGGTSGTGFSGGGGGGGGYSKSSYACSTGQTINYTVVNPLQWRKCNHHKRSDLPL